MSDYTHIYVLKPLRDKTKFLFGEYRTEYVASLLSFFYAVLENTDPETREKIINEVKEKSSVHRLFLIELPPYKIVEVRKE